MNAPQPAPPGSVCAAHPLVPARQVCARCGNFMCAACVAAGAAGLCPSCRLAHGAAAFPFTRDDYDVGRLVGYTWARFKTEWVMLALGAFILLAASTVGSLAGSALSSALSAVVQASTGSSTAATVAALVFGQGLGIVINVVLQGGLMLGLLRMCLDVLQGRAADLARQFSQFRKLGAYFLMQLLLFAIIGVPVALFTVLVMASLLAANGGVLPGSANELVEHLATGRTLVILVVGSLAAVPALIWVGLPLTFAPFELAWTDCGPVESVRRCWTVATGHRWSLFAITVVGFGFMLAGLAACCVGIVPAMGLWELLLASTYLALRTGSGLQAPLE
jgi:uncharacterized membrane protein